MSTGKLTPQEAAEIAVAERGIGHGGDDYSAAVWAIQLYEASRKRGQLTPEQEKAFEERVEELHSYFSDQSFAIVRRTSPKSFTLTQAADQWTSTSLRQLAAVCEAPADNLERFPS